MSTFRSFFRKFGILLFTCFTCTQSPTGTVDAPAKRNRIEGHMSLSDHLSPAGAFIWLEGFDISTRADSAGRYAIELPERGFQGVNPSGVEGAFKLHFFVANYFIKTLNLIILDGEFVYGKPDLLPTGEPAIHPVLSPFLQIRTEVAPAEIRSDYNGGITITATFLPVNLQDSVRVRFPELAELPAARVFLRERASNRLLNLSTDDFEIGELGENPIPRGELTSVQEVRSRPLVLTMRFSWRAGLAGAGDYEIVPFVVMLHQVVPAGLYQALGFDLDRPLDNYLQVPLGLNAARLVVRPVD